MENQPGSLRVVGLDVHPDLFTAVIIVGNNPVDFRTEKTCDKVPLPQLETWVKKNTTPEDILVLEASGNSFEVAGRLIELGRQALILDSASVARFNKTPGSNNDKISARRIAQAYLGGCRTVWQPDPVTLERRELLLTYLKSVKRTTQISNRISSFLSDRGVRIKKSPLNPESEKEILKAREWTPMQKNILEGYQEELQHAHAQRTRWRSVIAEEVLENPQMLSLVRICGLRDISAFAVMAIVGDIHRFESPKKLVAYLGLQPSVNDSGNTQKHGGLVHMGRKDLRSLLIQGAQAIVRSAESNPLRKWALKLQARKSSKHVVVVAVARKLAVSVWYQLMGKSVPMEKMEPAVDIKINKILTNLGAKGLERLKRTRVDMKKEATTHLLKGRDYVLNPDLKMPAAAGSKIIKC